MAVDDLPETIRVMTPSVVSNSSSITGLGLSASFETVMFYFDPVNDLDLDSYAYQLYDNSSGTGTPVSTGRNKANVFTVSVPNSSDADTKTYWGRVAVVNTAGTVGSYTSLVSSGATPLVGSQYISSLTAAKISAGTIGAHTITLGGSNSLIKSSTYDFNNELTTSGWYIRGDGHFSLGGVNGITYDNATVVIGSNVQVQANIAADSISVGNVTKLNINDGINGGNGGMTLGDPTYNYWYANGNFRLGNATNYVIWNGSSLSIKGSITADNGTFNGTVNASGGSMSGYLTAGDVYIGRNVYNASEHNGIGLDGSWNNAWVRRNANSTTYFRAGSASTYIQLDTGGSSGIYFTNFSVNNDGNLTATSANVTGTINATGGTFSGSITASGTITGGTLSGANFQLGTNTESGYVRMQVSDYTYVNGIKFYNRNYAGWAGAFYPYLNNSYDLGIDNLSGQPNTRYAWQDIRYYGSLIDFSDSRMKLDIQDSNLGINFIKKLKPVSYRKKTRKSIALENENGEILRDEDGNIVYEHEEGVRIHYGLIAQDVKRAIEDIGIDPNTFAAWKLSDLNDLESTQSLAYIEFISPIIKAIQELSIKVDQLESRLV